MNYLSKTLIFIGFLCFSLNTKGQDLEGGIFLGLASYQGDLVDGSLDIAETNMALGLLMRQYLPNDRWAWRANFFIGRLSGDDANGTKYKDRGYKFQSDIYELNAIAEWYFFDLNRYTSTGRRLTTVNLYLYAGAGALFFNPMADTPGRTEEPDFNKVTLAIPVGGGIKLDLLPRTSLGLELGFRPTLSDFVDGIGGPDQGDANDWYGIAGLLITVLLN